MKYILTNYDNSKKSQGVDSTPLPRESLLPRESFRVAYINIYKST